MRSEYKARTKKSAYRVGLRKSHPILRGLRHAHDFHEFHDSTGTTANYVQDQSQNKVHLTATNVVADLDKTGHFLTTSGTNNQGIYQADADVKSIHSGKITILVVGRFKTAGAINQILTADSDASGRRDFQFRFDAANKLHFIPFVGGTVYQVFGATAKNTTDIIAVAATYDGSVAKVFFDGIEDGSDSTMSGNLDAADPKMSIGIRATGIGGIFGVEGGNTDFYKALTWDRALSTFELKSLSRNVWLVDQAIETFYQSAATDTTPPSISLPTGTKTGSSTATGGFSTNEANGTGYIYTSTSATAPSAPDLKAGTGAAFSANQPVTSTGVQPDFNITGLAASTTYYNHFIHPDASANNSNIITSVGFTTDAAAISGVFSGSASAALSASQSIDLAALISYSLSSSLQANSTLSLSAIIDLSSSASISVTGTVSAANEVLGIISLSASASSTVNAVLDMAYEVNLAANANAGMTAVIDISAITDLDGTAYLSATGTGAAILGSVNLTGNSAMVSMLSSLWENKTSSTSTWDIKSTTSTIWTIK